MRMIRLRAAGGTALRQHAGLAGAAGWDDRATASYAHTKGWAVVIPPVAWAGGPGAAMVIGAAAGLLPALRAARLSPTQALWAL